MPAKQARSPSNGLLTGIIFLRFSVERRQARSDAKCESSARRREVRVKRKAARRKTRAKPLITSSCQQTREDKFAQRNIVCFNLSRRRWPPSDGYRNTLSNLSIDGKILDRQEISQSTKKFLDWQEISRSTKKNFSIDWKFLDRQKNFSIDRKFLDRQKNSRWTKNSRPAKNYRSTKKFWTDKKILDGWKNSRSTKLIFNLPKNSQPFSRSFQKFLDFHNISRQRKIISQPRKKFSQSSKIFLDHRKYISKDRIISRPTKLFSTTFVCFCPVWLSIQGPLNNSGVFMQRWTLRNGWTWRN